MKKFTLLFLYTLCAGSICLYAQSSYEMYETIGGTNVRVLNGAVLHKGMKSTNNDYSFPLLVKNVSIVNCTTWAKKVYINILSGTQNWFCWEGCYFPNTMVSKQPYIIGANQTYNGFDGHYKAAGQTGDTRVRYVFFNGANANDTAYFEVIYASSLTGLEDNRTQSYTFDLYPNPVKTTLHCSYDLMTAHQGAIVLKTILGEEVGRVSINDHEGEIEIDITGYPDGIYFCVLTTDDQAKASRKVIIRK
ncbi:MAG: T9SS type A sorting domain-containing protein [Bacteroidota bacterium]